MRDLIIVGAGGFASEVIWAAESMKQWNIIGLCVYDPSCYPKTVLGYPVLGAMRDVGCNPDLHYICAIGNNRVRRSESQMARGWLWRSATVIHPSAQVHSTVGEGTYVGAGAIIAPNATVGRHAIVNFHASIGHDAVIGDFAQIGPGARILGRAIVGEGATVGANAVLYPGVELSQGSVLGANSLGLSHLESGHTAMGIPAKVVYRQ